MLPMKVIAYWIVFAVTLAVYGTMADRGLRA